jgi:transposase
LAKVRPRDAAGKARRRVAAEVISDLERIYKRNKAADKELRELVAATGTSLLDLLGIGPCGAARLLVEVGDITRFPDKNHFASRDGTDPSMRPPVTGSATGCLGPGTGRSTGTSWPPRNCATLPKAAPTSTARRRPARPQ